MSTAVALDLSAAAMDYARRGWPVLPLHSPKGPGCTCGYDDCGSPAKHPRTRNGLKDASTDEQIVREWWSLWPDANIGLRTGVVFDVLDVDGDEGLAVVSAVEDREGAAPNGPTSLTGGGGVHRLFLPTGVGNRAGLLEHVDWRGANGYIVAPPSRHASGSVYEWADGYGADTPLEPVEGWLRELLFPPAPVRRLPAGTIALPRSGPGGYGRGALLAELEELSQARPGGRNHQLNIAGFNLYQLVAGGELEENEVTASLTQTALAIGLGEREIDATLDSARRAGFNQPRSAPPPTITMRRTVTTTATTETVTLTEGPNGPGSAEEAEPTGWEPVDVAAILAAGCEIPPASWYQRTDGVCLLYAGKMHAFNGEPESGKSWAAQFACAQLLLAGCEVAYMDFEDSAQSVIGRLIDLGVNETTLIHRFSYFAPTGPLGPEAVLVLRAHFGAHRPHLVIVDGVTEAMATLGLDPEKNAEAASFFRILPRRLARLGSAVVIVDHVTKDTEKRGRWAIGAQHKMAALDGAAYTFDTFERFGRNRCGKARVTITKDRPGHIRQYAEGSVIGEFRLDATGEQLSVEMRPPSGDVSFRPTHVMERISKALEMGPALTKNALYAASGRGKRETFDLALQLLVAGEYAAVTKNKQGNWHSSVSPYRAESENSEDQEEADGEPF